jgi:2-polyprenyl-3-methyl-5-hydroxy-6-metoxy-1,4-benzoquinol methylase
MPLFSRVMSRVSPALLRGIRNHLFLDMDRIAAALPSAGRVLEVGCGYGHVISWLAESRPDLEFVGVDPDRDAIARARAAWTQPNLSFESREVQSLEDEFDLVLLLDVIHHLPRGKEDEILRSCARRLKPTGRLLIKEMPAGKSRLGVFLDTYVSHSPPLVRKDEELRRAIDRCFRILSWRQGSKLAIGDLHVLAEPRTE